MIDRTKRTAYRIGWRPNASGGKAWGRDLEAIGQSCAALYLPHLTLQTSSVAFWRVRNSSSPRGRAFLLIVEVLSRVAVIKAYSIAIEVLVRQRG